MKDHAAPLTDSQSARRDWMSLLARAPEGRVAALLDAATTRPAFTWLRVPEIGSAMVQGRAGGTGAAFNLGEVTVTRCALTLPGGEVGHAYVQGRRKPCAEAAALVDALMQTAQAPQLQDTILAPLAQEAQDRRQQRAEKAAATKVDFFTMVRGDD